MVNVIMRNRPEQRLQDLPPVILIRGRYSDVGVKTAWPGQCRVEDLRPIGGSNNNNPAPEVTSEAVHLREKCRQDSVSRGLGSREISARHKCLDLINEKEGGRRLPGLGEHLHDGLLAVPDKRGEYLGRRHG